MGVRLYQHSADSLSERTKRARKDRKSDIVESSIVEKLISRLFFSARSANDAREFVQLLDIRAAEASDIGYKWHLSVINLEKYGKRFPFAFIGFYLLKPLLVTSSNTCKESTLIRFLHSMSRLYNDNPYHNDEHAGAVAHKTVSLIRLLNMESALSEIDLATVIIACLGHDAGHFGRTNNFIADTGEPLALIYNDASILENYHAFLTFSVLSNKHSNVLSSLTRSQMQHSRKMIIDMILTTDMAAHYASVKNFSERAILAEFDPRNTDADKWILMQMCLKMADIGHAALEWRDHIQWSLRLAEELYSQGEEEAALGLPVTLLCDRSRRHLFHSDQIGFLKYVVLPLGNAIKISDTTNNIEHVINRRIKKNIEHWRVVGEEEKKEEEKREEKRAES